MDAESLKTSKVHLALQEHNLKFKIDVAFEKLLDKLTSLTGEVLVKALGENPKRTDRDNLNRYWMELQVEVSTKIAKLTDIQNKLNDRCHCIMMKMDYMDLSGPNPPKGP